ncbi:epstein-Barr nuclear antigen 4 [Striga asiatica]|uniref:Epstein-Barr nuclear antigen 4 n=1 Tax=Striga asiatica TaxID=4170 RepID=A0A5A7PWU1_STRAF|nr:epstein-Barr nuclear antigen 4 [Striga asiatica]
METPTNKKERFLRMAPGNRKTQIISKAALQSMLNQAAKDSSTTASARIGVREHLNQSNVSSAGVTGANRTTEVHHGSSGEGDTTNHTNESGIPQTLEVSNQNQNLNAAEGSTGNLQDTSVAGTICSLLRITVGIFGGTICFLLRITIGIVTVFSE